MRGRHIALAVLAVLVFAGFSHAQNARIGLAEEFNSVEGWKVTRRKLASMAAEDGRGVFETHIQNLPPEVNGRKVTADSFLSIWKPGKPRPKYSASSFKGKAGVFKQCDAVDLDKFHYLVIKIDHRPLGAEMELKLEDPATGRSKTWPLQVAHSSGIIAQDLTPFGITGKQEVGLYIEVFPTGRKLKIDYIRLVSELLEEEDAGLIPGPITLPAENLVRHPYQKLEALYLRTPRPWVAATPADAEEQALFRDVGTHMPTWRMTGTPTHEGLNGTNKPWVWRADGSNMSTPRRTWHFDKQAWGEESMGTWKSRAVSQDKYRISRDKQRGAFVFGKRNEKGEYDVIYDYVVPKDAETHGLKTGIFGDRMVAGIIGHAAVVVDADTAGGKPAVKVWPLPDISAKGFGLNAKCLTYWAPFLSLHRINVDLDTGKITKGVHHTMTHGMGGKEWRIMSYDGISKVVINTPKANTPTPGKAVSVYGVYKNYISTDYGEMTSDYSYGITNGTRGELDKQYVLFDRFDAGTVLRLCTYNVSYETWDLRAKVKASPDYTKLIYATDMLGDADFYMTIMRLPSRPTNVKLAGNKLTWDAPVPCAEVDHYNVYSRQSINKPFTLVGTTKDTTYTDDRRIRGGRPCYLVTAEEHSGLESYFSEQVSNGIGTELVTLHFEAEHLKKTAPWREVVDGTASGFRAMRVTPVRENEKNGKLVLAMNLPKGEYTVWVRSKHWTGGSASLGCRPRNTRLSWDTRFSGVATKDWKWTKAELKAPGGPDSGVDLTASDPGIAIDKIILTNDRNYVPKTIDDRIPVPQVIAGLEVTNTAANSVSLSWTKSPEENVEFYSVYASEEADFTPGNKTLVASTRKTGITDWGIKPDTTYHYKVEAVNKRWMASNTAGARATTKPLDVVTKSVAATAAEGTAGLVSGTMSGSKYVEYRGKKAGEQSLTFNFDLPEDGVYYVWLKYTPTFNQGYSYDTFGLSWDGGKASAYGARPRPPRGQGRAKERRWFCQRIASNKTMKAGKHSLKMVFRDGGDLRTRMGQRIAGLWVSNNASFVPPGHTTQVMFSKPAPEIR